MFIHLPNSLFISPWALIPWIPTVSLGASHANFQYNLNIQNLNQNLIFLCIHYIIKIKQVLVIKHNVTCCLPLFWLPFICICKLSCSSQFSPCYYHFEVIYRIRFYPKITQQNRSEKTHQSQQQGHGSNLNFHQQKVWTRKM